MREALWRLYRAVRPAGGPAEIKQRYGLPSDIALQVRVLPNGWLAVSSPQLPGLVTQAQSQSELVEMVNDAVLTYYGVPRREADIIYDRFDLGDQLIQYQAKLQTQAA
jgi:hypothetical protein